MLTKSVAICVAALFAVLQLGHSLKCYNCWDRATCNNMDVITCDEAQANVTMKYLENQYRTNLSDVTSRSFSCFSNNVTNLDGGIVTLYKGCVFRNVNACDLDLSRRKSGRVLIGTLSHCKVCTSDKCNSAGRVPAGLWSVSFVVIIGIVASKGLGF